VSRWHVGLASGACTDRSILDVLPDIWNSGARGFEIGTPPRHFNPAHVEEIGYVVDAVRQTGLQAVSIHAPFGRTTDLASIDRQHREAAISAVATAADALARIGGRVVVVHPSDLERQGRDIEAHLACCVRSVEVLADYCRDLGLTLALETPLPHLIGGHPDEFRWLVGQLDPSVRVCIDTGHVTLGHHWHRFLEVADGRLVHVHASDNHGSRDDHLPPGDGRLDWTDIARTLDAADFHGWIMLELACPGRNIAAYFRRAFEQASGLLGEGRERS
jgi:sugar phosphate isomerase/epimerase